MTLISPTPGVCGGRVWGEWEGYQDQDDSPSGLLEEEEKNDKDEDRPLTGDCCCQTNRDGGCL